MRIGIEAGGTKVVCGLGTSPGDLTVIERFPTTKPDETMGAVADYVRARIAEGHQVDAVGLASFGPLDLDERSPTYGHITTTPKPGWRDADLLAPIRGVFDGPVGLDTDVNGAALGELRWGAGQGLGSLAYVTVGTGIGAGIVIDGRPIHGLLHPEVGHLLPRRHPQDSYEGHCPTHGDCLEGLAAGPAWGARWGSDPLDPETRQLAIDIEAHYLGQLVVSLLLMTSPERIVIGGGVAGEPGLLDQTRAEATRLLAGYIEVPTLANGMRDYVVAPGLGGNAGILGAIALAEDAGAPG